MISIRKSFFLILICMLTACGSSNNENQSGNVSEQDTQPPTIELIGSDKISIFIGETYEELGVNVKDNIDKNVAVITSGSVNNLKAGVYTIIYSATDTAGNKASLTRQVTVSKDSVFPQITVIGSDQIIQRLESYNELGATAKDNIDKNLSVTTTGTVNTSIVGIYTITYSATDSSGNTAQVNRIVEVTPRPFSTTWLISSGNEEVKIQTNPEYDYNFDIDWGDGEKEHNISNTITHIYPSPGEYTITISGQFPHFKFAHDKKSSNCANCKQLQTVNQWGEISWQSMQGAFEYAWELKVLAEDVPNLSEVSDMSYMFHAVKNLNANLNNWDVSNVSDMTGLFKSASDMSANISDWNVSQVTSMASMFEDAYRFSSDISQWDVSSVTDMNRMFKLDYVYPDSLWRSVPLNISGWDVSSVRNMSRMFETTYFNENIETWDVSNVTDMSWMFANNEEVFTGGIALRSTFNQPLNSWDVSNVETMEGMFYATPFNQDLSNWDTSSVKQMSYMFYYSDFNQDISSWNVSNVTDMAFMFAGYLKFYEFGELPHSLFFNPFNQDISNWDVSNVQNMVGMFSISRFNKSISKWNVSNVESFNRMFVDSYFNQNISNWDISNAIDMTFFNHFSSFVENPVPNASRFSQENYDAILMSWSQLPLKLNVNFDIEQAYSEKSTYSRQLIIDKFNWNISDQGLE